MAGGETMTDGGAVVVTDHVVAERDIALPREIGRARRPGVQLLILQSAVSPVPVWTKHGRYFPTRIFRAIKIARDVEPRVALEINLHDRLLPALDLPQNPARNPPLRLPP